MAILYNLVVVPLIYLIFLSLIIFIIVSIIFSKLVVFAVCDKLVKFLNWGLSITKPENFLLEKITNYYFILPYYLFAISFSEILFVKKKTKIILVIGFFVLSMILLFI